MIINLTYMFFILVGVYFGIVTYIETRKRQVFLVMGIFILSFGLEIDRLNTASYRLDLNDFLRTARDIIRTIIMVFFFQCMRKHFSYSKPIMKKKSVRRK